MASLATETDLLEAVRKSLNDSGTYCHFKAEIRASVMSVLNKTIQHNVPQELPEETKLLNELIREYLEWNGYIYSDKIFGTENGDPTEKIRRENLSAKLGVMDDNKTSKIPLLYYILSSFRNQLN